MSIASASAPNAAPADLQIGEWRLAARRNELQRGAEVARLEPRATEVLAYLAARPGEVVAREELLEKVWPGVVVGDDALTQAIIKLRKALGDDSHSPSYIETVSKRGYRLIAPVTPTGAMVSDTAVAAALGRKRLSVRLGVAAALVAVAVVVALLAIPRMPWPVGSPTPNVPTASSIPTVAILPLSNLSGDAARDYFSDGLTEDLISALGRFSALRVMSRSAVEPFKTRPATPQAVRAELGARYVVKGSVREADGRLRVAVELSDAERGIVLWSDRFDGEGRDVFDIQDRIVKAIVSALAFKVSRLELERASARPVESLEAHDLVLRAREQIRGLTRERNRQARAMLARALELAPSYAEALATLAHAEYVRAQYGWIEDPVAGMRRAESHARRALGFDDIGARARAHAVLARIHSGLREPEQALLEAERAIALNPSDTYAQASRGHSLIWLGRLEEAVESLETVRRFEPDNDNIALAVALYTLGRYSGALASVDASLARHPGIAHLHATRAAILAQLGDLEEARGAAQRFRRLDPFTTVEQLGTRFRDRQHTEKFQEGLRKAGL